MAKVTKRGPKAKPVASGKIPVNDIEDSETPAAFTQAPSCLADFLEDLSPKHVYLIHIDGQPKSEKQQMFLFPLILNTLILALVLYRIYVGIFTYPDILAAILGRDSPATIDPQNSSWSLISSTLARRTLTFLLDYLLLALFLPWPIRFIFGPIRWRLKIGFQQTEIVVRKSRAWSESLARTWIRDDEETMKERIIPAITPMRLRKTGYLLIDADWDLDFHAMIRAHEDIKAGRLRLEDFETCVIVHGGESKGWLVWRVEETESIHRPDPSVELSASERDKIVAFKNKLTSMGKEDLFFRWVEIIQFESTQPGGFTPQRQQSAMVETKELFERHGVDFEKFWADVGGMEGVSI
ncbi:hypothetical protein PRK78_000572 [Emydomyces testavorans]|uniref:Uncharacterized protein n=1 Tax=Emydomyces testavorans TaxID=2070801 RepID=A0AAF0DBP3_9EURO|nr:hypothetical protein PRK78_000572 [Emydomyces testavorans]